MKSKSWFAMLLVVALAVPALAASKGGKHWDQRSERLVREDFSKKDALKNVKVEVEDGIATLTGDVDLLVHKMEAEKRAKRVDRVTGVRNEIHVAPAVSKTDEQLNEELSRKLAYDRIGFGNVWNTLSLNVTNGVATVTGKVRDYPSRDSAVAIVQTTAGVKGMVEDIDVAPPSRFDDELRMNVARAVYGHATLQKYAIDPQMPIRIVVDRGRVQLHGVVANAGDKQIALAQARSVPGSFAVDDQLLVASDVVR